MPVVPFARTPDVSLAPLPGVRATPNAPAAAFGGVPLPDLSGTVGAVDRIAQEQQRIAYEEKKKADAVAVNDQGAQLVNYATSRLHGTPDADGYAGDPGLLHTFGKNAIDASQNLATEWNNATKVMRDALTNDDQKLAFDQIAQHEWASVNEQVQRHVATQRIAYDNQTTQGALDAQGDKAVQSYADPMTVEPAITASAAIIAGHAQRNGLPPEFVQAQVAKNTSAIRLSVVQSMLDNEQDLAATQYFDAHKTDFVGRDFLQAEKLTQAGSVRAQSQQHADEILKSQTTLPDAVAAAHAIQEPRVRDETEQRIRRFFSDQAADLRQQRESSFFGLSAKLAQNGGNVDKLKATPDWLSLAPQDQTALERRAFLMRHPKEGAGDAEQFLTLLNQAYFNPDDFAQQDFQSVEGLSTAQITHLMNLQRSVGNRTHREETSVLLKLIDKAGKDGTPSTTSPDAAALGSDPALEGAMRGGGPVAPGKPATTPQVTPGASAAPVAPPAASHDTRGAGNPLGLSAVTLTPLTPSMVADIVRKGPRYAAYLRSVNVDVPADVDSLIAAEKAKAAAPAAPAPAAAKPKGVTIVRDSAGRATALIPH